MFPKRLKPGYWVIVLTLWWVLPFLIRDLSTVSIREDPSSYYLYIIVFGMALFLGLLLNILDHFSKFYKEAGHWKKYLIVCITYAINIIAIMTTYFLLPEKLIYEIEAGCAAGSFGILFIPSIVVNFFLGGLFVLGWIAYKSIKEAKSL
jgi:hypothetical protein